MMKTKPKRPGGRPATDTVRKLIILPAELAARIEAEAEDRGATGNGLIRVALKEWLDGKGRPEPAR